MRAIAQFTIVNICDVVTSYTPPAEPYLGQLWVDTSQVPPQTMVWNGSDWVPENDLDSLRTTVSTNTERIGEFQTTADGLNSYVSSLTETVETISNDQGVVEERVLSAESHISELQQTVDGLTLHMEEQYVGGMNYVQNSAGLNGITDDWITEGTVSANTSTDVQNNTTSDSSFLLSSYSGLKQIIRGVVTGSAYAFSIRAKKTTSGYSSYFQVQYNGNKVVDLFNTTTAFDWTEYTAVIPDVQDSTITISIYNRDGQLYVSDIMMVEGATIHKWTPAPNEIYTAEVKIDRRGIEVSNSDSAQRTVINNTEFSGYYNDEKIFTPNKDETQTKKTTVDGELTVGKTKFVPMATASQGLNIVILD